MTAEEPRSPGSVTDMLLAWKDDEGGALEALMERVYTQLESIAALHFRNERADHTLEPAALVNEVYLRLADGVQADWRGRQQFFALASKVMRRVLVEHARARSRRKRRGIRVPLREEHAVDEGVSVDLIDLERVLERLEQQGLRLESRVIQLRFFGGLTIHEVGNELGVSDRTVGRAWRLARAWLWSELRGGQAS